MYVFYFYSKSFLEFIKFSEPPSLEGSFKGGLEVGRSLKIFLIFLFYETIFSKNILPLSKIFIRNYGYLRILVRVNKIVFGIKLT